MTMRGKRLKFSVQMAINVRSSLDPMGRAQKIEVFGANGNQCALFSRSNGESWYVSFKNTTTKTGSQCTCGNFALSKLMPDSVLWVGIHDNSKSSEPAQRLWTRAPQPTQSQLAEHALAARGSACP